MVAGLPLGSIHSGEQGPKKVVPIRRLPGHAERKRQAEAERPAPDREVAAPAPRIPVISTASFAGMNFADGGGSVPPDTIAAAGPDHIVEVVNSTIAIYDRTTGAAAPGFPTPLETFFGATPGSTCIFDPVVAYDEIAERFYVGALDVPEVCGIAPSATAKLRYAVSDNFDPTAGFTHKHVIDAEETSNSVCGNSTPVGGDFTRTGWNFDAHVFAFNMFDFPGSCFDHVAIIAIDKNTIDTGALAFTHIDFNGFQNFTLVPARMHDASNGDPMWLVEEASSGNALNVVRIDGILTNSPAIAATTIAVAGYGNTPNAAQKGGGFTMDAGDTGILHVESRGERLVAAQTVGLSGAAKARWYELDISGTPALTQMGTIDPGSGVHTYYPSIAIAPNGDLGMTFMQSSKKEFVSMYVTGQSFGDPPGTMQTPKLVKAGLRNYTAFDCTKKDGCRAGDYSGITVDPDTPDTFCAANEYATANTSENWGTWIACFKLAPIHDLAVTAVAAPKTAKGSPVTLPVTVTIQNRSEHSETVQPSDLGDGTSNGLVQLTVTPVDVDGEACNTAGIVLDGAKNAGLFSPGNKVLAVGQTMTVSYKVTYDCSNRMAIKKDSGDYSHSATVHHDALALGAADTHTADDACPRPAAFDPNPLPNGTNDKGCGAKKPAGGPVLTNVTP